MKYGPYKYQLSIIVTTGLLERILSLGEKPTLKIINLQVMAYDFEDVSRIGKKLTAEMKNACSFQYYLIDERILFGN